MANGADDLQEQWQPLKELDHFIISHPKAVPDKIPEMQKMLEAFLEVTEANRKLMMTGPADNFKSLLALLKHERVRRKASFSATILQCIKVLMRKEQNRLTIGREGVMTILKVLAMPKSAKVAEEGANAVLNMCYDKQNVVYIVQGGGVEYLVNFLSINASDVLASTSGALQSICFEPLGRKHLREIGAVGTVVKMIFNDDEKVQSRIVGVLHNLSSDTEALSTIRQAGVIPKLVELLKSQDMQICGSAAGAIQNISREAESRDLLLASANAVRFLSDLLFASVAQCQVCAVGALMNLIAPTFVDASNPMATTPKREAFKAMLSDCVAFGSIYSCLFD